MVNPALTEVRDRMFSDLDLLNLYLQGDKNSSRQTRHDRDHADLVAALAIRITQQLAAFFPLDSETQEFVIPCAAWLHDIGRAVSIENHHKEGALIAWNYLIKNGVPADSARAVTKIIAMHRTSVLVKKKIFNAAHAIVVMADKSIGDESRVRTGRRFILSVLSKLSWGKRSCARLNLWHNANHDRINYAIKKTDVMLTDSLVPGEGIELVLTLTVDEKIAAIDEIVYTDWYANSFATCIKAARFFGLDFRIQFNGDRYGWHEELQAWSPVHLIQGSCQ